jgi:GNAT superfamily N-acetyltransferase
MEAHAARFEERSQIVTTLCEAFFDDPVYRWLVPDDVQRRRSAVIFYSRFVDACWPHGGIYSVPGSLGAALWLPPGKNLITDEEAEAFTKQLLDSAGDDDASARMAELFQLLNHHHPADTCWYLAFMGVRPAVQGQGIGGKLLEVVLAEADRGDVPAYLEASCPENRRLYERHGFQTVDELSVADSPTIYAMWRTPTSAR